MWLHTEGESAFKVSSMYFKILSMPTFQWGRGFCFLESSFFRLKFVAFSIFINLYACDLCHSHGWE